MQPHEHELFFALVVMLICAFTPLALLVYNYIQSRIQHKKDIQKKRQRAIALAHIDRLADILQGGHSHDHA